MEKSQGDEEESDRLEIPVDHEQITDWSNDSVRRYKDVEVML